MKVPQKAWAALWIKEGGPKDKADTYSAIVMAESGGDSKVQNSIGATGGPQILLSAHPDVSEKCAKTPACATRKSIQISNNGSNFSPWVTYTSGAYKAYLGKSGIDSNTDSSTLDKILGAYGSVLGFTFGGLPGALLGGDLAGGGVPNPLSGIDQVGAALAAIAKLIERMFTAEFWVRFGKGLLGALLIVYAMQGMMKATLGIDITSIAKTAALK